MLTGCLAFFFWLMFDLNKLTLRFKILNISFAIGMLLLAYSTIGILLNGYQHINIPIVVRVIALILAVLSFLLLIYVLFYALPFDKTYKGTQKNQVIATGMYALCRHPGAIWFFFFYIFLWLASSINIMLAAAIIWPLLNIIYVYIQDKWILPHTLFGYDQYQKNVPFLVPSFNSLKDWILRAR